MPAENAPFPIVREAVAAFAEKAKLRDAAARLLAAGFKPTDLSVLASHDSLEVAGDLPAYPGTPASTGRSALIDEIAYIGPLTIAGIIFLSAGPLAAGIAALVGAGVGAAAIKDLLDHVTANRHSTAFAAALEAGEALLWVRVDDPALEPTALRLLEEAGGRLAHMHGRAEPLPPVAG